MSDRRRTGDDEAALDLGEVGTEATEILQEIDHAAVLLGEILGRPGPDRRRLVEEQPRFRAMILCDLLL